MRLYKRRSRALFRALLDGGFTSRSEGCENLRVYIHSESSRDYSGLKLPTVGWRLRSTRHIKSAAHESERRPTSLPRLNVHSVQINATSPSTARPEELVQLSLSSRECTLWKIQLRGILTKARAATGAVAVLHSADLRYLTLAASLRLQAGNSDWIRSLPFGRDYYDICILLQFVLPWILELYFIYIYIPILYSCEPECDDSVPPRFSTK